ncbi:RHS repeat-associated core domain-containing protein [Microbulbifer aggregans]|uniref:RHS repeat-associated core domain-containing protein n=1 Tax=Microbulbifer aggregans TaxID=1769779 RepID=UPI001CFCFD05|nr:RHS repeat-associated core domain-containing protein [Microbulbifer aggregans]
MQILVENQRGDRFRVSEGWATAPTSFDNDAAAGLLASFSPSILDQIYDQFLASRSLALAVQHGQDQLLALHGSDAPSHFSETHRAVYVAVRQHRLLVEVAPLREEELDARLSKLRNGIRMGLQKVIAEERAEAARIQAVHEKRNNLEKTGAYVAHTAKALGQAAWGLAVWTKDVADVAALVNPVRQQTALLNATYDYYVHDKSYDDSGREYLSKIKKELVEALGFDPTTITAEQLEQAFDIAHLIYDDPTLRSDISRFAKDYAKAQHSLEIAEFIGGGLFEIILTIILTAVTGGVGAVAAMAKNARLLTLFKGIGDLMVEFARYLRRRKALAKTRGAKSGGASLSDLKSTEATVPAVADATSGGGKSSGKSAAAKQSDGKASQQPAGDPNEPDKNSTDTGRNHNGDSSQCNGNTCSGGDPINLKTGEEFLTLVDAVLDGPLPLTMARTYRSSNHNDFGLGYGWTHTLGERLEYRGAGNPLHFHDNEGRVIALPHPGGSGLSHNVVEKLSLKRIADNHWVITPYGAPAGLQKHFKALNPGDNRLALSEIRDGYNNFYRFHYVEKQLICVESSLGEALHISPIDGRIGELKKETRDGRIQLLARYEYSAEGDLIRATDAEGFSEAYAYQGHVISKRTLKTGYNFHFEWDAEGPGARCLRQWGDDINGQPTYNYRFVWDDDGKGVNVIDTRGGEERYRFNERALPIYHRDQEGGETLYEYNALGQLTAAQLPAEEGQQRQERYEYDDYGRLVAKTDASGGMHRIEYNAEGLPAKITDAGGRVWKREYNTSGQITASTDPLGHSTQYTYNPIGLVGSVTDPLGNTTRYLWNPQGKLAAVHDPMGRSQHYRYDIAQRLTEVQHAPELSTRYEYDSQDRISAVIAPDGGRTEYRYNAQGLVADITDAEGRSTRYDYDGLSQVTARTNPDGSRLQYQYDGERNLVGLINENGEQYQLKYDLKERLIEEVGFDGRVTRYAYNAAGHLVGSRAVTDSESGKGIDTLFERDAFGRLLQETTPDGVTSFRYNRIGQVTEAENAHRKLRWEYDACGRVIGDWQDNAEIRHRYDAAGNRIASVLPDGEELRIGYNAAGQFESLHRRPAGAEAEQLLAQISRDELGRETHRQHGNGLATESQYDPQGRLQKLRLGKGEGPVENPILERAYGYNRSGQLTHIGDSLRGDRQYHYDALDRLTQVEGPNPEHFVHDPAHNILAAAGSADEAKQEAGSTQVSGNRLKFRGDTHYEYDVHGNRIAALRGKGQKLQTRYRYNSKHQLIAVAHYRVDDKGEAQLQNETCYQYDALGRRISKKGLAQTTDFLWDGDVLLQERARDTETGQDLKSRNYYFEPATFKPIALSEGGDVYSYHLDQLGTPDALTDADGGVVWSVSYKSYGNVAIAHKEEIFQPIRFQGQYYDEESGFSYSRFRYYDSNLGSFLNQDPIGLSGGVNSYRYVPNPLSWIDPFGLTCKQGVANIKMYKEGRQVHFVVEVQYNGQKMVTEQQSSGRQGGPTEIQNEDFSEILGMKPDKIISTILPDAQAAIDYQVRRSNSPDGPYCVDNNSCLTHVFDVLREGGKEGVPNNSKRLVAGKYLKKLEVE